MRRQIVIMLLGLMTTLSLPAFAIAGSRNTDSCLILKAVNIVSAGNSGDSVCWDFRSLRYIRKIAVCYWNQNQTARIPYQYLFKEASTALQKLQIPLNYAPWKAQS